MACEHPSLPDDLSKALARLVDALQEHNIAYALIAGLAAGYHSRPRFTRDIDLVLQVPQIALPRLFATKRPSTLSRYNANADGRCLHQDREGFV